MLFRSAFFAVIIRADLREKGLARQLLRTLLGAITAQGVRRAVLVFPADQTRMLAIAGELGFERETAEADASQVRASKALRDGEG